MENPIGNTKKLFVSGGSKGIGKAIVEKYLQEGWTVFTCARDISAFQSFPAQKPGSLFYFEADLSTKENCQNLAHKIGKHTSQLDVIVNNAGYFIPGSLLEESDGTFESMINANTASAYHMTRFLAHLIFNSKSAHIFNICSTASITPYINGGSYCISKFAMLGFSKVLREELKSRSIKVTSVLPGATLTNSWAGTTLPEERFMQPEEIASIIYATQQLPGNATVEEILIRPLAGDIN